MKRVFALAALLAILATLPSCKILKAVKALKTAEGLLSFPESFFGDLLSPSDNIDDSPLEKALAKMTSYTMTLTLTYDGDESDSPDRYTYNNGVTAFEYLDYYGDEYKDYIDGRGDELLYYADWGDEYCLVGASSEYFEYFDYRGFQGLDALDPSLYEEDGDGVYKAVSDPHGQAEALLFESEDGSVKFNTVTVTTGDRGVEKIVITADYAYSEDESRELIYTLVFSGIGDAEKIVLPETYTVITDENVGEYLDFGDGDDDWYDGWDDGWDD